MSKVKPLASNEKYVKKIQKLCKELRKIMDMSPDCAAAVSDELLQDDRCLRCFRKLDGTSDDNDGICWDCYMLEHGDTTW
jgi:hypothetical protein